MDQGTAAGQGPLRRQQRRPHRGALRRRQGPGQRRLPVLQRRPLRGRDHRRARSPGRASTSTRPGRSYEGEVRQGQPQGQGVVLVPRTARASRARSRTASRAPAGEMVRPRRFPRAGARSLDGNVKAPQLRAPSGIIAGQSGGHSWLNVNVPAATPSSAAACRRRSSASSTARRKGIFKMLEAIKKN